MPSCVSDHAPHNVATARQVMGIFTGNSTGKVGGLFFPQGFANGGPIQRLSPPSTINVRPQ